ncbi:MAG: hypothetical protein L6R45_29600 [Anaerolineae bacterium]|nr:hypothetical protein [Anaerolineae bacterium]
MTTPTKDLTEIKQILTTGFSQVNQRLDGLETRVLKLEQEGPILKTRLVGLNGSAPQAELSPTPEKTTAGRAERGARPKAIPRDQIIPRHDNDEAEDEAIAAGSWAKIIKTNRCNRVSLTKTRKRDCWKMILSLPGRSRPATFIGWDGPEQILTMFADVMPELSLDDFDNGAWAKKDKGQERPPILKQWDVNFTVEWFQTAPTGHNGATFISVETVYPLYEED